MLLESHPLSDRGSQFDWHGARFTRVALIACVQSQQSTGVGIALALEDGTATTDGAHTITATYIPDDEESAAGVEDFRSVAGEIRME